jgi:acetyltransferase-like isoleucine patch superfamily enzyme
MKFANIALGKDVEIDPSTSINNVKIGNKVRIAKRCSIYGGQCNILEIGDNSYVGMNSVLNGFAAKLTIGANVSISQFVNIMVDSGPNASPGMMKIFPIEKGSITIGHDSWIGASAIIMPNVTLGEYCVVASNSFVNKSFPPFSIIGGTPAKLIRTFTEEEKEIILGEGLTSTEDVFSHYETNYIDLPFENRLRRYRVSKLLETIARYPHRNFLEIGSGPLPIFHSFNDFDHMVVVEPEKQFFNLVNEEAFMYPNVHIINNHIEKAFDELKNRSFDFIVIGGFLHEINNSSEVLEAVRGLCSRETIVYSYVPNANSFHRLLALKMGLIDSIYQKSEHDELFDRQNVFNRNSFNDLMKSHRFKVIDSGSYFLKPFTHSQMDDLLNKEIINEKVLDGLDRIIEFFPDMGAELWNICKIDD